MVNDVGLKQEKPPMQGNTLLERQQATHRLKPPIRETGNPDAPTLPRWNFPEWFIIAQTLLPALLLIPGTQVIRTPIRVAPYAISLLGLVWWWSSRRNPRAGGHPASPWLLIAIIYLGFQMFHPLTNSLLAGTAQVVLYLTILAPVLWAPGLVQGPRHLARLLILLFVCNGINSCVGILQVYNPDVWMPEEFSRNFMANRYGLDALSYIGPEGRRIVRPPGLFDAPGAVCGPAMVTSLLGLIFCLAPIALWKKVLASVFGLAGMAAIYLSHVRSSFLVVAAMVLVSGGVLMFLQREHFKATMLLGLYGSLLFAAFTFAVRLGGQSVSERFASLLEEDPFELFYKSRGEQLEYGFNNLLVEHPLGAGLGRWGMVNAHFADPYNSRSRAIWAEVQPNAWIIDGGLVLLLLYGGALLVSTLRDFRLTVWGPPELRFWALAVLAANAGTMALIFSYTPFTGQIGMQYWFLTGALQGAAAMKRAAAVEGRASSANGLQWQVGHHSSPTTNR
jgi:hypothetical protein